VHPFDASLAISCRHDRWGAASCYLGRSSPVSTYRGISQPAAISPTERALACRFLVNETIGGTPRSLGQADPITPRMLGKEQPAKSTPPARTSCQPAASADHCHCRQHSYPHVPLPWSGQLSLCMATEEDSSGWRALSTHAVTVSRSWYVCRICRATP
jgi:hypothetical protein